MRLSHFLAYAAAMMAALGALPVAAQNPLAETVSGRVEGRSENGQSVFRGIPFAAPPVGPLRWRPPQAPAPWNGVRDAGKFGNVCPQRLGDGEYSLKDVPMGEDCLTLNIWSPDMRPGAKLPVMVWIHGGSFRIGAGGVPLYDGGALAKRGAVIVTLNYRLGLLGIFAHPALAKEQPGAPRANYAIMDQIAALQWVRDNIARFGGDPGRVTIFGESAGGVSVLLHMISPASRGLFAQAIVESGGGWTASPTLKRGEEIAEKAGELLGAKDLAALRAIPADRLVDALAKVSPGLGYSAVIDGKIVPESIPTAFLARHEVKVPLLIGSNSYEQSLMAAGGAAPASMVALVPPALLPRTRAVYGGEGQDDTVLGGNLFRDGGFSGPARWLARINIGPGYYYRFAHLRVTRRGKTPGPGHGAEILFVFDSLDAMGPGASAMFADQDRAMARVIGDCWVSFAKTGVPECGGTQWQTASKARGNVMLFDQGAASFVDDAWRPRLDHLERLYLPLLSPRR